MKNYIFISIIVLYIAGCKTSSTGQATKTPFISGVNRLSKSVEDTSQETISLPKKNDPELTKLSNALVKKFTRFVFFDDKTGKTIAYNLMKPKGYDARKKYPLVMFIADASVVGKGSRASLRQGYGGLVWATTESQNEQPCFVLVPSYWGPDKVVNDQWEASQEAELTLNLLDYIIESHSVDTSRVYATGQSMGGMLAFHFNVLRPKFFAASLFVASQWNPSLLKTLENESFFYVVAQGDSKASKGMTDLKNLFKTNAIPFAETTFSAQLSVEHQNQKIKELLKKNSTHNFVLFEKGTTLNEATKGTASANEHMSSFDYAYKIKEIRQWLFKQHR